MNDLHKLLFEKERIGKVLDIIRKGGIPDPQAEPERALLYAQALYQYGDLGQAKRVYSSVSPNPAFDAERLWGLSIVHQKMGSLEEARHLLDEALKMSPPVWLLTRIYNSRLVLCIFEGDFEAARRAYEQGVEIAEREPTLVMRWVLEGNLGFLQNLQGLGEEGDQTTQRAVRQLQARDCVQSTGLFLLNLGIAAERLGDLAECERCFVRADKFIEESESLWSRLLLRITQGDLWENMGKWAKAERAYAEAGALLREQPYPETKIRLGLSLARLAFKKGDRGQALRLLRSIQAQKGFPLLEEAALFEEGRILMLTGAVEEGLKVLGKANRLVEKLRKPIYTSVINLYLARGYEEMKQRNRALECLNNSFSSLERSHSYQGIVDEREALAPLLLRLVDHLPLTEALSTLVVRLRHPGLIKRLLKRSPEGKARFISALKVHDAPHFRASLAKLRNDPDKEVRRTSRLLLSGWQNQVTYRAYALGGLRVLLEGRPLTGKDWMRPAAKRLFLFLLSQPGEWHPTDTLVAAIWNRPDSERTSKHLQPLFAYLRLLFEPWHLPDMKYVFFQSQRGAYGFFPGERFWMDYQEFERGIKKAEKDQLARNFKEARKAYRVALDLYLGDYLEEFPYEDWLNPKRDHLRELYFRGVMRYATLERDSGNLHEARRVLEEALFKDLSRCDCMTLLVQTLAQMKLTQQAKDWGQRHIKYMKEDLKEKPAPEVVEALGKLG